MLEIILQIEKYAVVWELTSVNCFFLGIKRNLEWNLKNVIRYKNQADTEVLFPTHLQLFRCNVNILEH